MVILKWLAKLVSSKNVTQFGRISQASFKPAYGLRNPHLQTILPKFLLKTPVCKMAYERVITPDNDFVDLAWSVPENAKALVILFHGLEGSSKSHYIQHLVAHCNHDNIACVLMHFRGCSGVPNLTSKAYHSGATFDPLYIVPLVKDRYPHLPLFAIGFSLGANMLMKLMAEHNDLPIEASAAVSAPLNLAASAESINKGFSSLYQWHLMKSMKANLLHKMSVLDMTKVLHVTANQISKMSSFREFDNNITSVLHGFKDADNYYQQCSALPDLHKIQKPTLILHAKDDPFMNTNVIPTREDINSNVAYELSEYGGHVGFLTSLSKRPKLWLPQRLNDFISEML